MDLKMLVKMAIDNIRENIFSMILQTILTVAIASYAMYQINGVKKEISGHMTNTMLVTADFTSRQAEKIDKLTTDINTALSFMTGNIIEKKPEDLKKGLKVFTDKHVDGYLFRKDNKKGDKK
jgi:Ni,Fe-hydrogenase III large subunit